MYSQMVPNVILSTAYSNKFCHFIDSIGYYRKLL